MTARPDAVQEVLDAAREAYGTHARDPRSTVSLARIFGAIESSDDIGRQVPTRLPVCAHLAAVADPECFDDPLLRRLAAAFLRIEPEITWRRRGGDAPNASPEFPEGHANAMLVGPGGLLPRQDAWLGVSLLAPGIRYPDHTHAPEETYLVLSQGSFSQDGGPWFEPGVGGSFYNRPNILHAMRAGNEPLFAFWALWAE